LYITANIIKHKQKNNKRFKTYFIAVSAAVQCNNKIQQENNS